MKHFLLCLPLSAIISCSEQAKNEDVVLVGDQAHAAFLSWQESVQPSLGYPKSFHSEVRFDVTMAMPEISDVPEVTVSFAIDSDTILHDVQSFEARSDLKIDMLGIQMGGHIDLDVQPEEVALRLRDAAYMGPLIMNLPSGYRLSGDHVEESFLLLQETLEDAIATDLAAFPASNTGNQDILRGLLGPSAILHPNFFPSMVMSTPNTRVSRWEVLDSVVLVEFFIEPAEDQLNKENWAQTGVSLEAMTFKSSFDFNSGDARSFHYEIVMGMNQVERMAVVYDFQYSELEIGPAKFSLADEDSVLDLNPYYQLIKDGRVDEIEERFFEDLEALDQDFSF